MKEKILISLVFLFLSGCFSITTKYPPIEYYKLHQEPVSAKNLGKTDVTLMIRDFTIATELDNESLWAQWDNSKVQIYYYHRWITNISEMITDFFHQRYSNLHVFMGGVVKASSWIVPDYILEGNVLEMTAVNSESKSANSNYTNISIQVTLARRTPMKIGRDVVFTESYNQKVPREDNTIASIIPAFSKGFSQIADKMLLDIQNAIAFDNSKEGR